MKKILLLLLLSAETAMATSSIDLGLAASDALISVSIRAAFAFLLFKLITLGINRKTSQTPIDNGRYVCAWFGAVALVSTKDTIGYSLATLLASISINTTAWLIIGFVGGYLWRLAKPIKTQNDARQINPNQNTSEELIWTEVANEFSSPNRKEGLWAKCFAESEGIESKAKALYLKRRANELLSKAEHSGNSISTASPDLITKTSKSHTDLHYKVYKDKPGISTATVLIGLAIFGILAMLLVGIH